MSTAAPARFMPSLDSIIAAHAELRAARPLVQCLTNVVSANFMANVLLAAGASPAMVDNPEEAAGFARVAGAVLVNLGTPTSAQVEGMRQAVRSAVVHGTPWVLDPIGAGGLPWRGGVAAELLQQRPAVVRGNASEIIGLAGLGQGAPGFESSDDPARAVPAAVELLRNCQAVSASGAVDHIPLAREVNLSRALEQLKEAGFFCIGLDERGKNTVASLNLTGKVALVLGAEGEGLRRLVAENCDELVKLPTQGPIASLNVSNAAAVALYELIRK